MADKWDRHQAADMGRHSPLLATLLLMSAVPVCAEDGGVACPGFVNGKASQVDADRFHVMRARSPRERPRNSNDLAPFLAGQPKPLR
jgi:hypothetical protein